MDTTPVAGGKISRGIFLHSENEPLEFCHFQTQRNWLPTINCRLSNILNKNHTQV